MPAPTVRVSIAALLAATSLGHMASVANAKTVDIAQTAAVQAASRKDPRPASGLLVAENQSTTANESKKTAANKTGPQSEPQVQSIIVTASRRPERLQNVPLSIVALSQKDLATAGITKIDNLAAIVPGVEFGRAPFGGQISYIAFRGLQTVAGASTVGVYVDDTPIQGRINPGGYSFFGNAYPVTFDLKRVEVLRGPQGTLFGAGSEGGTVRFIFNQPSLDTLSGFANSSVSTTKGGALSYEFGAAAGGPIVQDSLGYRASAYYRTDGGYVDRVDPFTNAIVKKNANEASSLALRLAVTKKIGDNIKITPSFIYQRTHADDQSIFQKYSFDLSAPNLRSVQLLAQPSTDKFYLGSVRVDADLSIGKLTSVTSYFSRDANTLIDVTHLFGFFSAGYGNPLGVEFPSSYADAARQPAFVTQENFTQEIRLASGTADSWIQWVAGAFFSNARQDEATNLYSSALAGQLSLPATDSLLYTGAKTIDTQYAAFGQADIHLMKRLVATLGVRVAHYRTNFSQLAGGYYNDGVPPVSGGTLQETPITPKVGLSYHVNDDNMVYASISRGYRVGGANAVLPNYCAAPAPQTYKSDYVWNYEVGSKNQLFGGRLQIDGSLYYLTWNRVQENLFLPCGFGFNANAGEAVSKGFNLALQLYPTQGLQLGVSVAYSDAKHTQDYYYAGLLVVQKGDWVGALPQVVAPWNVTTSARYDFSLPGSLNGYFWVEDLYRSHNPGPFASQIPTSIAYVPEWVANPSTNQVNLRFGLTVGNNDLSLFVNNVTDTQPLLYKNVDVPGSHIYSYSTFRPRTIGLSINHSF